MTFAFHPKRPFTEDFRAVGGEQIERAIAMLEVQPEGVHEAIHDARKSFKRLRSLYRLVVADAPLFQRQENARFRAMARNLSTFRDAAALVENAGYLRQHAASEEQQLPSTRSARSSQAGATGLPKNEAISTGRSKKPSSIAERRTLHSLMFPSRTAGGNPPGASQRAGGRHCGAPHAPGQPVRPAPIRRCFTTCAKAHRITEFSLPCFARRGHRGCGQRERRPANWSTCSAI